MPYTDIIIGRNATQMEEHLTNALVYVISQYRPSRSEAGGRERSSRISALINVLAWEISGVGRADEREAEIRGLLNEVMWRVGKATGEARPITYPPAH